MAVAANPIVPVSADGAGALHLGDITLALADIFPA